MEIFAAQCPQNGYAIKPWQHAIDDYQSEVVLSRFSQALYPVRDVNDRVAPRFEVTDNFLGSFEIIFYKKKVRPA